MSARRARGRAKDSFGRDSPARGSPGRGRARGRGRWKVRADDESVELNPVSAASVSEAFDPSNLDRDEVTSELNAINTKRNDPANACIDKLQDTDATLETTLNSEESKIKTEKESDIINIVADAVSVAVNVTDNSRKRSKKEPVFIELDSDDDDEPAKANKERDLKSSSVDIKASYGLETLSNERDVFDAGGDVINLDDDDDDDDDDDETVKDEHHFYCTACDINCKTKQGFENHAKGSYHCQRVKATNEDKGLRDEEEKQAVDTAAAAEVESDEVKDEEEKMEIGIDADATEEAEEDAAESSQSWILLDQMHEEDEVALDAEADKIIAVAQDSASAAKVKVEPETVQCDAFGTSKEKTSSEDDELTKKERIQKDTCSVIDAKEGSDDIDAREELAADKSCVKKEADDDDDVLFKKTDELDATHKEAIADTCYSVDDTDEETGKCDDMELDFSSENEELSESEQAELADDHEKNTDGDSGEAICKSTKEVNVVESNEQEEQQISDETEKAAAVKATGEQGDDDLSRYYCAACNVQCDSDKTYHMHTRGMMHTLNCGSSSSAAERPAPVPQVYRVPKEKSKKSGTKKSKKRKASGEGTADDVILIDADESDDAEDEEDSADGDDVEEVDGSNNSKEYNWLENAADDPYYCDVCDCSMNSEQNYSSHLIGARHKKNMKSRDLGVPVKKPKGKVALGGRLSKVVNYEPKAQEMLNNCRDALIGLEYMTEFCHSSPDVEPRYVCNLCESRCDVRMVILHLTGLKHRINYLKKHHTNYAILVQQRTRKSDQTPLADEFAKEIEAAVGRRSMVVKLDMGIKEERRETGASVEPRKRRNSLSRRTSPTIDVPSVSPEERNRPGRQEAVSRVRRRSRSDSRHRDRSPRRLSARQRTWSPSRDRQSIRRDYDRDRQSSRRSIERDRRDHDRDDRDWDDRRDYRGSTSERKPRSDFSRYEQDSGRMKSLLSPALHVLYASGRKDSDRDRRSSRRSSEQDRYDSDRGDRDDRDYRGSTSERRRRSDYSRHEQGSRTAPSLPSPAKALYAASTNYPYAQPAGVPYGLVSPAAFAMSSSYTAALGTAYSIAQRATVTVPPPPKRSRLSDPPSAAPVAMSYAPPPSALGLYGPLGAQAAYANLYGAHFLSPPPPQPVPPVAQQSPVMSISSTSYQKSLREHSSTAYGTKPDRGSSSSRAAPSDNSYSTFSSIVASVASGTKDDDEAAAMSKVIAEAVIKFKMQKAQEKAKQARPPDQYQRQY